MQKPCTNYVHKTHCAVPSVNPLTPFAPWLRTNCGVFHVLFVRAETKKRLISIEAAEHILFKSSTK